MGFIEGLQRVRQGLDQSRRRSKTPDTFRHVGNVTCADAIRIYTKTLSHDANLTAIVRYMLSFHGRHYVTNIAGGEAQMLVYPSEIILEQVCQARHPETVRFCTEFPDRSVYRVIISYSQAIRVKSGEFVSWAENEI
jgi:hypothetical protein